MSEALCVCYHKKSQHHRSYGDCRVCACDLFTPQSKRYHVSRGHRHGIKGKVYSQSQLLKRGRTPPYAEEIL